MADEIVESVVAEPVASPEQSGQQDVSDNALDNTLRDLFEKSDAPIDDPIERPSQKSVEKPESTKEVDPRIEVKPESVRETPKPESKQTPVKPVEGRDLADPNAIKTPPNLKNSDGWKTLKTNYEKSHSIIHKQDDEIKQLKGIIAEKQTLNTKEFETLKKENEELRGYRYMLDAENDPEFIKNHDEPMNRLGSEMTEMLKRAGIDEKTINDVDFSNSTLVDKISLALDEHVDRLTGKRFLQKAEEYLKLNESRDKFINDYKTKYNEFKEKREKERFAGQAEESGRMLKAVEMYSANKTPDGKPQFPFLVKKTPEPGAPQQEIENANAHNKMVDLMSQKLDMALKANNPEDKAAVAIGAVYATYLLPYVNFLSDKNKSLQAELKKISNAGSENKPTRSSSRPASNDNLDLDDAMRNAFPNLSK